VLISRKTQETKEKIRSEGGARVMSKLSELPNIGTVMEKRLASVRIYDAETLRDIGSREAFERLLAYEGDTCFCSLCGLEGAVQNVRWHSLSREKKQELKDYFQSLK
jgi:DNA transformation protein